MKYLLLLLPLFIYSFNYEAIPKLEWMGPENQSLERYQDYLDQHPYEETHFELIKKSNSNFKGPLIGVFVETALYSRIASSISVYINDLQNEGYDGLKDRFLRNEIQNMILQEGYCIASSGEGYFLIQTQPDLNKAVKYLESKAKSIFCRAKSLHTNFYKSEAELAGQDQLRFNL